MAEYLVPGEIVSPTEAPDSAEAGVSRGAILYEAQIKKLMDALDARRQMPFDPMMMKVAAGFLKPTKTGGFGESLGYAAEGASEEAEKEMARKTDVEKLKLELAAKQYGLAQDTAGRKMLFGLLGGDKTKVETGAPDDGMTTEQVVDVVKKNPNTLDQITLSPERVAAITAISPSYGKIAEQLYTNQVKIGRAHV